MFAAVPEKGLAAELAESSCCRSGNIAIKAQSAERITVFGASGSATLTGDINSVFVRLFDSASLGVSGKGTSSPQMNQTSFTSFESSESLGCE